MGAMEEFEAEHDWSSMRLMRKRNGIGAQSSRGSDAKLFASTTEAGFKKARPRGRVAERVRPAAFKKEGEPKSKVARA
jgi:hypothetical protein